MVKALHSFVRESQNGMYGHGSLIPAMTAEILKVGGITAGQVQKPLTT
jgi:hypothetical protein